MKVAFKMGFNTLKKRNKICYRSLKNCGMVNLKNTVKIIGCVLFRSLIEAVLNVANSLHFFDS
jgi:hypothetical protein